VFLLVRMALWAGALPLLKVGIPLPRLVRLVSSRRSAGPRDLAREEEVIALARALYRRDRRTRDKCLERSLVTYRFLASAGAGPWLHVGMRREEKSMSGHVWVTLDGEPVHDSRPLLADLVPVLAFDPRGELSRETASASASPGAPPGA
jgi:hypothetical protein